MRRGQVGGMWRGEKTEREIYFYIYLSISISIYLSIYVGKICVETFESVLAHAHCCLHMRIYI